MFTSPSRHTTSHAQFDRSSQEHKLSLFLSVLFKKNSVHVFAKFVLGSIFGTVQIHIFEGAGFVHGRMFESDLISVAQHVFSSLRSARVSLSVVSKRGLRKRFELSFLWVATEARPTSQPGQVLPESCVKRNWKLKQFFAFFHRCSNAFIWRWRLARRVICYFTHIHHFEDLLKHSTVVEDKLRTAKIRRSCLPDNVSNFSTLSNKRFILFAVDCDRKPKSIARSRFTDTWNVDTLFSTHLYVGGVLYSELLAAWTL